MPRSQVVNAQRYELKLTETQSAIVLRALELYSRLLMGQTNEVERALRESSTELPAYQVPGGPDKRDILDLMKEKLEAIRRDMGFAPGESYGIMSPQVDNLAREAFDILQVLRYRLAWSRAGLDPETDRRPSFSVEFDTPFWTSLDKAHTRPECRVFQTPKRRPAPPDKKTGGGADGPNPHS